MPTRGYTQTPLPSCAGDKGHAHSGCPDLSKGLGHCQHHFRMQARQRWGRADPTPPDQTQSLGETPVAKAPALSWVTITIALCKGTVTGLKGKKTAVAEIYDETGLYCMSLRRRYWVS